MLGVSSAMNAMIYIRGIAADFDEWVNGVAPGVALGESGSCAGDSPSRMSMGSAADAVASRRMLKAATDAELARAIDQVER